MGRIFLMPGGASGDLHEGETLLSHLQRLGADISARCGGTGDCGSCRVRVQAGYALSRPSGTEEALLDTGIERLACQAFVIDAGQDITVTLPATTGFSILEKGLDTNFLWDPAVTTWITGNGRVLMRDDREAGSVEGKCTGVSVDAGTTTLVIRWYDLERAGFSPIASASILNPQVRYGDNVIDRVRVAMGSPGGQFILEKILIDAVNGVLSQGPVKPSEIYEVVVVGNTVMRDLFVGYPVKSLGKSPFVPFHPGPACRMAGDIGISINPAGRIYAPPIPGHFVGADMLAVILAAGMHEREELTMAIDIGTNTEIAMGNREKILVCSCASGPAFEGSGVKCGTGAIEGAIAGVVVHPDFSVTYQTIGNQPAVGICGSGIVDALAGMLKYGYMDQGGRLNQGRKMFVISEGDGKEKPMIFLDGEDIDSIKLAKSAVSTGIHILMNEWGTGQDKLSLFFLAGAFGNSISPENAEAIGIIPVIPREKVIRAGNAAIEGASMILLSRGKRMEAEKMIEIIEHVSLENSPEFEDLFIEGLSFETFSS